MTKQNKELLLKDLCARLPYGMKFETKYENHKDIVYELFVINKYCETVETNGAIWWSLEDIKPYLRPMSSMTDEEKMYVNELIYDKDGLFLSPIPTWVINECDIGKYIDFCNSKHLDWRGLISKGLALPAPDEMYDFK